MASATSAEHGTPAQNRRTAKHPGRLTAGQRRLVGVLTLALVALLGTMGCSLTSLIRLFPPLTPSPTPIAFLTPVLQPTFTPTVLPLTDTPFPPTPTITPTATDTPNPKIPPIQNHPKRTIILRTQHLRLKILNHPITIIIPRNFPIRKNR